MNVVLPAVGVMGRFIGVMRVLDHVCARAKLDDVAPHVLWHAFASIATELGFTELTIAERLGYASRGVTQRYIHLGSAFMSDRRLAGKRAIMSGASSGFGRAAAKRFIQEGASIGLISHREQVFLKLARALRSKAMALPSDIADDSGVAKAVAAFDKRFGGVDIIVNSAGIAEPSALADLTPEVWRRLLDVNLSGTFYLAREAGLRTVKQGGGIIINMGSELGLVGVSLYAHYCASKFGFIGLTKALALELAPAVRVNCICPGPIDTPMMTSELEWFPDPAVAKREAIERVSLKRFASPEQTAQAVLFFTSDARFAIGSAFSIDGGATAI